MVLHGDVEDKERFARLLLLVKTDQILIVGPVRDVIAHKGRVGKVPLKEDAVEAEVPIDRRPVPPGGEVGVHEHGLIPQRLHLGAQIGHPRRHVHLEGHGAVRQEGHGVPCEEFKLGIGRGAPEHRGVGRPLHRVLRQAMEKGHGVLVGLQTKGLREIGKGLVHNDDQVDGALPAHGGPHGLRVSFRLRPNGLQRLLGIPLRLGHGTVAQAHGKIEEKAVSPGGPKGGFDPRPAQKPGAEKDAQIDRAGRRKGQHHLQPGKPPSRVAGELPQQETEEGQRQQTPELYLVGPVVVISGHIGGRTQGEEVARKDGAAPEPDDIAIHEPNQDEKSGGNPGGEDQPSRQQVDRTGDHVIPHQIEADLEEGKILPGSVVVIHTLHQEKAQQRPQHKGQAGEAAPGPPVHGKAEGEERAEGQRPAKRLPQGQPVEKKSRQQSDGQRRSREQQVRPQLHGRPFFYIDLGAHSK